MGIPRDGENFLDSLSSAIAAHKIARKDTVTSTEREAIYKETEESVRQFAATHGVYPEELPTSQESYKELVKREAARIAEEERQEALKAESRTGLWGQLPEGGK